jgi:hypothetical protein
MIAGKVLIFGFRPYLRLSKNSLQLTPLCAAVDAKRWSGNREGIKDNT